jgi:glycosyltransferase involved in cell wall biosynthesis
MNQDPRHILLMHYHLRAGGVTAIIERQLIALSLLNNPPAVTVLTASKPSFSAPENLNLKFVVDKQLDYLDCSVLSRDEIENGLELVTALIKSELKSNSIIHFHNPTLGKNGIVTAALASLANSGVRIVYHCHDFAEDRPLMMAQLEAVWLHLNQFTNFDSLLYPKASTSYLFLNKRDMRRFQFDAIGNSSKYYLPNPVSLAVSKQASKDDVAKLLNLSKSKKWILYPVRAIERKNIGELILLSLLFKDQFEWIITAAPENPQEKKQYEQWVEISRDCGADILFNSSAKIKFEDIYSVVDMVITTSFREGFGLSFLEPWLANIGVYGRDLKMVTDDMREVGVVFSHLYKELLVEVKGKWFDFATLSLNDKKDAIIKAINENSYLLQIYDKNKFLNTLFTETNRDEIENNREAVLREFSIRSYGETLMKIYNTFQVL